MFNYILGLAIGFYAGGAVVTSIIVSRVMGEHVSNNERLVLVFTWPYGFLFHKDENNE